MGATSLSIERRHRQFTPFLASLADFATGPGEAVEPDRRVVAGLLVVLVRDDRLDLLPRSAAEVGNMLAQKVQTYTYHVTAYAAPLWAWVLFSVAAVAVLAVFLYAMRQRRK